MANYCSNRIAFFSPFEAPLKTLHRQILLCMDDFDSNNFLRLLLLNGYSEPEAEESCDRRDSFSDCDPKITKDGDTYFFEAETETAWSPHMEVLQKMLAEKYHNTIRMVYTAEEPGCGVYYNSDTEGRFFSTRYKVDCCHDGDYLEEYFAEYQQLVDWVNTEYTDINVSKYDNADDIEKKVSLYCSDATEDDYFYIDHFDMPAESEVA